MFRFNPFIVAVFAVFATFTRGFTLDGTTVLCDAPSLFAESRALFQVNSNATSFDIAFAMAIDTHCWPSFSEDTWESRLDQHMNDIHERLHELNQLLEEQFNEEHKETNEEEHEETNEEEHKETKEEEHEMEAGKIVAE